MVKKSISLIPNGQIQRLRISLMELFAMNKFIKSEDHHIDEELVAQLYRDSQPTYRYSRLTGFKPWFSFYDQLDDFYEACLLNRIENDSVRYFYARKMTVNECITFKKSYQSKDSRRYDHTWKKYLKELYRFEETAKKLWRGEELLKKRKKSYQRSFESLSIGNSRIEEKSKHSEFCDHQLFHGRRMTIQFTGNNGSLITEQLNDVMKNDWSTESLSANNRHLMRLFKDLIRRMHRQSRVEILDWTRDIIPK